MRLAIVVLLASTLQGCFFFYIPGSMLSGGGNTCATEAVAEGGRIKHADGRVGTVSKLYGRSERCQDGRRPILADVKYD